jgi:uncharacterized protein YcsI (UPF0317 family)
MAFSKVAQRSVADYACKRSVSLPPLLISMLLLLASGGAASAACSIPNQLTNGQTADAGQVMGNLNALANCTNTLVPAGAANSVQYNLGSGGFGAVGPLSNGQVVVGTTGAAPQAAALSAGPGITITNGPGSITISSSGGGAGSLVVPPQGG